VSVDEYQLSEVDVILDNVLLQLEQNPDRRFTYAETNFFAAWFRRQSLAVQSRMKRLVDQGRFEFVNGGWVQHDEAGPLYGEMIDQTTRGHLWLKKNLNVCPTSKFAMQLTML
jgi:alpha-mannosidase